MSFLFHEFSKFSDSLNFIEKKLDANYEKLDLKINNIENQIYPNNKNGKYNHNIDINNENFKIKNLSQLYIDNNFNKNQKDLNNTVEKVESCFISNNENFLNHKRKNIIVLSDDDETFKYDEHNNFNNNKCNNFNNEKNKKIDFNFDLLSDNEEEFNFIKKSEEEFLNDEFKKEELPQNEIKNLKESKDNKEDIKFIDFNLFVNSIKNEKKHKF